MQSMNKAFALGLAMMLTAVTASASVTIGIQGAYFSPSDSDFKNIYGGGLMYGSGIAFGLTQRIDGWLEGGYFSKAGSLTYTKEETKLTLIPIGAGLREYRILPGHRFLPHRPRRGRYYLYREENALGGVKTGGVGFVGKIGLAIALSGGLGLDIQAKYSSCKLKPADFSFDVGGFEIGAGVGFSF